MSEKANNSFAFKIDNPPSEEDASENPQDFSAELSDVVDTDAETHLVADFSYSNKSVKKAGKLLRNRTNDIKKAAGIIQNFRAAHEQSLNVITDAIKHCCDNLNISVKIGKRLKRANTIVDKLQRPSLDGKTENKICILNMNDIGGCRFIFPDIDSLNQVKERLSNILQHNNKIGIKKVNDYITKPKTNDCGYRGVHIHFCHEHASSGKKFNIEAQLRTERQHLWATTVEIVDILEGTKIKTRSHSANAEKENKQVLWEEVIFNHE